MFSWMGWVFEVDQYEGSSGAAIPTIWGTCKLFLLIKSAGAFVSFSDG